MGRNCNSGIAHNREEGGGIAVVFVLAARRQFQLNIFLGKKKIKDASNQKLAEILNPSTMMSQLGVDAPSSCKVAQQFSNTSSKFGSDESRATSKYSGSLRYFTTGKSCSW